MFGTANSNEPQVYILHLPWLWRAREGGSDTGSAWELTAFQLQPGILSEGRVRTCPFISRQKQNPGTNQADD